MSFTLIPDDERKDERDDDIIVLEHAQQEPAAATTNSLPVKRGGAPTRRLSRALRREQNFVNALKLDMGEEGEHVVTYEVAEQMRLLVSRAEVDVEVQNVAVTSTVPGEGASYIARSLAAVMAHDTDKLVCLVEFDWDKSGAVERVSEVPVDGIGRNREYKTGRRFTMVRSGYVAPLQRSPFVSSESLHEDLQALREYFDVVILDLPAIATHTGVLGLSEFADRYVLVAQQGAASMAQVRASISDLGEDRFSGVVLNKAKLNSPKWVNRLFGAT